MMPKGGEVTSSTTRFTTRFETPEVGPCYSSPVDPGKANIKPNIITYSTMLKGHCQTGGSIEFFLCFGVECDGFPRDRIRGSFSKNHVKV